MPLYKITHKRLELVREQTFKYERDIQSLEVKTYTEKGHLKIAQPNIAELYNEDNLEYIISLVR